MAGVGAVTVEVVRVGGDDFGGVSGMIKRICVFLDIGANMINI